jgi:hypothetical protein
MCDARFSVSQIIDEEKSNFFLINDKEQTHWIQFLDFSRIGSLPFPAFSTLCMKKENFCEICLQS